MVSVLLIVSNTLFINQNQRNRKCESVNEIIILVII